ncbi:hypothetical protein DFJ58DRAFT_912711 [Suillus subalutaceus]|uniref:uncharacterized protein n=1 Tax=Suillus subalutaceus TaxID=48586 RepID=UPI001B8651DE|nr:uncharacterized protein DFJ58DRAFT_912711 [Suillus subalutaceus]KAG1861770.1 hypothetical protein DFJ58DRAFT_912711 [Suillus subalutaceus]
MACKMAPSPPRLVLPILVLPHTTLAALSHPLLRIYMPFSNAFRPSSTTLDPMPMQQPNSSNAQTGPYSLAVLALWKLLQYGTRSHWLLLRGRYKNSHAHALLVLVHQVQHLPSHHPFHGGPISYSFSAVHHLDRRHKHSHSSKAKRMVSRPRPERLYRILNLLPRCPRHFLPLLPLPHQIQQRCSHNFLHYGLASFFFSAVSPQQANGH